MINRKTNRRDWSNVQLREGRKKTANIQHVLTYITCAHKIERETEEKEEESKKFMNNWKTEKEKEKEK